VNLRTEEEGINVNLRTELRPFSSSAGEHVLVVDGSRIYDLDETTAAALTRALDGQGDATELNRIFALDSTKRRIDGTPLAPPPLHAISLTVAQSCNMGCGYCYADEGRFGGARRMMCEETARATVDRLLAEAAPGATVVVGFMGGEPLLNRRVVHATARYAVQAAAASGHAVRFTITTNGTVLKEEDVKLFSELPFTVAVSLDGDRAMHDATRPLLGGGSSYDRLIAGMRLFERHGRPQHLAARVTVTPPLIDKLGDVLEHGIGLGFDEVGFAAVLSSPDPRLALGGEDFPRLLNAMVNCGETALAELKAGRSYPFGNFETALGELHRGSHRPYPCGAAAGYLSASSDGGLFACHRFVDDPKFAMGDVRTGPDHGARALMLAERHVDRMDPCRQCWARYLCGGGCHHEVVSRGRPGCDYIRGWLQFCLRAYVELLDSRPEYFVNGRPEQLTPLSTATTFD
jgi:uncharacterized protein